MKQSNNEANLREDVLKNLATAYDSFVELVANLKEGTKVWRIEGTIANSIVVKIDFGKLIGVSSWTKLFFALNLLTLMTFASERFVKVKESLMKVMVFHGNLWMNCMFYQEERDSRHSR